ncbi:ABC transporter permease [Actinophytocola xinjiangensis]|uniref:ABC transporter permease n=1 Tax=Actinophytocola xinjiangensis TaxID=485602 RepID=A0A7Z1AW68_9PSEU|nr:carbohydrate ABC transporter permease [Actinophytocola xinjiangensis]OLF06152.1 ABC transporter permease [Actinophytocola xinjiangensis]
MTTVHTRGRPVRPARVVLRVFLTVMALGWLFPIAWAVYNSLRDFDYTSVNGYFSFGGFTFDNYLEAWTRGNFGQTFYNTAVIVIPSVLITLLLASSVGFVLARFSFPFNLTLLALFTAANLLPQQALLVPLFRLFLNVELPYEVSDSGSLYDTYVAVIAVNIAFQTGFCTFVLSNYMKTLPKELTEAALVDGAGVLRQYWQVVLPLCRPALAALATLQITWVYNDFFWAVAFMRTGDKLPVTSSLQNLRGQFFTDYNLLSAGSVIVAIPTLVIFFLLQRHLRAGLTLGATKG